MKIKITEDFKKLIQHMLNSEKLSIDFILCGFPKYDFEGGLLHYKTMLYQYFGNEYRYLNVIMNSGYEQRLMEFSSASGLKRILNQKKFETQNRMCEQLFGEDWLDNDDFISDEQLKEANEIAVQEFMIDAAVIICTKVLQDMVDNKIDNKFYGFRDENNKPVPVDKGTFTVVDAHGKAIIQCAYKDLSQSEELYYDLLWNSKVTIPLSTIENVIRKAKLANVDLEIYKGQTDCNDEKEECSLDYVTIYVTPEGKIREERIHTY